MRKADCLPILAIIVTKNESRRIEKVIQSLQGLVRDIWVVDSNSVDGTQEIARNSDAQVINFSWNNQYPKKRQYTLDHYVQDMPFDWVLWIDADEVMTPELAQELKAIDFKNSNAAGYFIRGRYVIDGQPLKFGMQNNKIALMHKKRMSFPVVNDLDIPGMGEIEGHYQPVKNADYAGNPIPQIRAPLLHDACDDMQKWQERHKRYKVWERGMDARKAWPQEDSAPRRLAKKLFRAIPPAVQAAIVFIYGYIFKLGCLDGAAGYKFAIMRAGYYFNR